MEATGYGVDAEARDPGKAVGLDDGRDGAAVTVVALEAFLAIA